MAAYVVLSRVVLGLELKLQMFFGGFQGRTTQQKWLRRRHVSADVIFTDLAAVKPEVYLYLQW